jgi:hypothetical protein
MAAEAGDEAGWQGTRVKLLAGDLTQVSVDAIVNAANSALAGGTGGNGAIHSAAGPAIMAARNVRAWLSTHPHSGVEDIIFVLRGAPVMAAFRRAQQRLPSDTRS